MAFTNSHSSSICPFLFFLGKFFDYFMAIFTSIFTKLSGSILHGNCYIVTEPFLESDWGFKNFLVKTNFAPKVTISNKCCCCIDQPTQMLHYTTQPPASDLPVAYMTSVAIFDVGVVRSLWHLTLYIYANMDGFHSLCALHVVLCKTLGKLFCCPVAPASKI